MINFLSIAFDELMQYDLIKIDVGQYSGFRLKYKDDDKYDYLNKMHIGKLYVNYSNNNFCSFEYYVISSQKKYGKLKSNSIPILDPDDLAYISLSLDSNEKFYSLIINCYKNYANSNPIQINQNNYIKIRLNKYNEICVNLLDNVILSKHANFDISKFPHEFTELYLRL